MYVLIGTSYTRFKSRSLEWKGGKKEMKVFNLLPRHRIGHKQIFEMGKCTLGVFPTSFPNTPFYPTYCHYVYQFQGLHRFPMMSCHLDLPQLPQMPHISNFTVFAPPTSDLSRQRKTASWLKGISEETCLNLWKGHLNF